MQSEETHLPAWMDFWNHVRDLAQARGMYFGSGASARQLQEDSNFRMTLAREYNPAITTWGISDCHSWLGAFDGPDDVGPLPWNRSYGPKPALLAMKQAFVEAAPVVRTTPCVLPPAENSSRYTNEGKR